MSRSMRVELWTPAGADVLEPVLRLRLEAADGSRGILPGHEAARLSFAAGPVELARPTPLGETIEYVATEGGVARIDPGGVTLLCRWAARADSLESLREHVSVVQQDTPVIRGMINHVRHLVEVEEA